MGIELTKKTNKINFSGELLRGEPGGYYIPNVDDDGVLTWTPTVENMPGIPAANIKGNDGITPFGEMIPITQITTHEEYIAFRESVRYQAGEYYLINVSADTIYLSSGQIGVIGNGDVVEIYSNGMGQVEELYVERKTSSGFPSTNKVLYVVEKSDGGITYSIISDGATGKDGKNGISPTVSTKEIDNGHEITFAYGGQNTKTIELYHGEPGKDGVSGKDGAPGKDGSNGAPGKNGSDGVSVTKVEVDSNNHLQVTLSNGKTQDAGAITVSGGGGGSVEYELLNSFKVTATDVANSVKGFAFSTDKDGKEFSVRAITAYCYFPAATGNGTFEIAIKNPGGASKGIHKRTDMLATSERWLKIDMELKGYWTGGSTHNTTVNGVMPFYDGHSRNNVSNPAYYINLTSNIVLPEGTTIEVYGVRA